MALDFWMYGDPARVVEAKQNREAKIKGRGCDGCINVQSMAVGIVVYSRCELGKRFGNKCEKYQGVNDMAKIKIDINYIEQHQKEIHGRLCNWALDVADRAAKPNVSPMFRTAILLDEALIPKDQPPVVDHEDAQKIEKAVCLLPKVHRDAVIWFYIKRISELKFRKQHGHTLEHLYKLVRDGRQMLINRLK